MATSVPASLETLDGRRVRQVTVIVVGAGIAGLACARELVDAGVRSRVLERGRVVGGRLASIAPRRPVRRHRRGVRHRGRPGVRRPAADAGGSTGWPGRGPTPSGVRPRAAPHRRARCAGRPRAACAAWPRTWPGELDVTLEHRGHRRCPTAPTRWCWPCPARRRCGSRDAARRRRAQAWSPVLAAVLTYPERRLARLPRRLRQRPSGAGHGLRRRRPARRPRAGAGRPLHRRVRPAPAGDPAPPPATWPRRSASCSACATGRRGAGAPLDLRPAVAGRRRSSPGTGDVYLAGDAFGRPRVQTAWLSGRAVARAILARRQSTER